MKSVTEKIPTYQIGAPEINPIFFTGRVYQGAEGYIYPYPLYDVLTEKKVEQDYNVLRLDNQYVRGKTCFDRHVGSMAFWWC